MTIGKLLLKLFRATTSEREREREGGGARERERVSEVRGGSRQQSRRRLEKYVGYGERAGPDLGVNLK